MSKYIERNAKGAVIAAWSMPHYERQDSLPDDDPALWKYLTATLLSQKLMALDLTIDDVVQAATRPGVHVDRDPSGLVVAVHDAPLRDGHELASRESPDVRRFLAKGPVPAAPDGLAFTWIGGATKWRVLRTRDNVALADGLESPTACAVAAARFVDARQKF